MNFELEAILHKKYDMESKSGTFQTREFVVVTDGTYPQYVKFQLTQDKCSAIDAHNEGDKIKVAFDLRGREWQGKFFTNLNAWRVDKVTGAGAPTNAANTGFAPLPSTPPSFDTATDNPDLGLPSDFNDLPF
jgi:single-strand DNA-binding protein